jgi:serine acetyltransferase
MRSVAVGASLTGGWIFQDWHHNDEGKARVLLAMFRTAQALRSSRNRFGLLLGLFVTVIYRGVSEVLGVELPVSTRVGVGFEIRHGFGLVVNPHAVIGSHVRVRHATTIGNRRGADDCPVIGDACDIGAGVIILGGVTVGRDSRIGAGSVVLDDVPDGAVVAGNPARVIRGGHALAEEQDEN